jgi:hypothetical protein
LPDGLAAADQWGAGRQNARVGGVDLFKRIEVATGVAQPGLSGAVFSGVRMKIAFESRGGDRAYWLA